MSDEANISNQDDDVLAGPLPDIDISNFAEDDSLLLADSDFKSKKTFVIVILLFVLLSVASLLIPNAIISELQLLNSVDTIFTTTKDKMTPLNRFCGLSLQFNGIEDKLSLTVEGEMNITLKREDLLVLHTSTPIPPTFLTLKNNLSEQFTIFGSDILDFTQAEFSILPIGDLYYVSNFTANWISGNPQYSLFIIVVRVILTVAIVPSLIGHFMKLTDKESKPFSVEQKMTIGLSFCAFLYANPFMIFQYFNPSATMYTIDTVLRDVVMSYLSFYLIGLYSFFGRDKSQSIVVTLAMPYMFLICILIIFVSQDLIPKPQMILPNYFEPIPPLQNYHYAAFIVTTLVVIIRAGAAYGTSKKVQLVRYRMYTYAIVAALLCFGTYLALRFFVGGRFEEAAAIPMALVVCFALVMEYAHTSASDELVIPGYVAPDGDENGASNPIGIDEDPLSIEQKEMLGKIETEA